MARTKHKNSYTWTDERLKMRLRSLANVFTKTNRILTGDRSIKVSVLDAATIEALPFINVKDDMPGLSYYPNIWLNASAFDEIQKTSTLVGLLGLNYHELSHLMFTPRGFKTWLGQNMVTTDLVLAYSILEDQRIESFFTALYEPAGKFFTETFVRFVMTDDDQYWPIMFLFSYGRGFLPLEIREEFEARFVRQDLIPRIKRIIDDYKAAKDFSRNDKGEAVRVLRRFKRVLDELKNDGNPAPEDKDCGGDTQDSGQKDTETEDEAREKDKQRRQRENRTGQDQSNFWDEDDDDEEDEDSADGDSGDSGDDESGDEGDGDADSEDGEDEDLSDDSDDGSGGMDDDEDSSESDDGADGDGSGDSEGDSGDDGSEEDGDSGMSEDDGDSSASDGEPSEEDSEVGGEDNSDEGGSSDSVSSFSDQELREYMDEISEAIEVDENVQEEVGRITAAMNDNTNIDVIDFGKTTSSPQSISMQGTAAVRDVSKDFARLWAEVEPGWKYGSDVGKLNVDRAMRDLEDFENMFDEWDEGRESDVGLEVFISLDISGSMVGAEIQLASEAMWILKRSLDSVEAKTTVVGFHEYTFGLYDRNDRAKGNEWPLWTDLGGATCPALSMKLARTVFETTTLPNKLFILITDGGFSQMWDKDLDAGRSYSDLVDEIPGTKMYVGVGGSGGGSNIEEQKHFDVSTTISNPLELVPLVKRAVEKMIREKVR